MKEKNFLSGRLGFSNAQADAIQKMGIDTFLEKSFQTPHTAEMPVFLNDAPKSRKEYREMRQQSEEQKKMVQTAERLRNVGLAHWWINKMATDEFPLREKMVLFWHNHFVSGFMKVRSSYAMFQQNQLFREQAFGNIRELTRAVLYDNAMLTYLDNVQNKAKTPNENLSRELLELFTLGVGNYTEQDIKEGARALAGLNLGEDGGRYYKIWEDNSEKTYLNKHGNFKADDMVEIIFQHPKAGNRFAEKLLKAFVTDMPNANFINDYAHNLRQNNFEIKPFFKKLVHDERFLKSGGAKIKDPLTFLLETLHEFQLPVPPARQLIPYFQGQDMVLFNPPNVKGWDGGKQWLSAQKLIQRSSVVHILSSGKNLENSKYGKKQEKITEEMQMSNEILGDDAANAETKSNFSWNKSARSIKDIINDISDRLLYTVDDETKKDIVNKIGYDFDPNSANAQQTVTRVAEYLLKLPEYQVS